MLQIGDMTGKAGIVTGAASGLGRATALALADAHLDLLIVDVNEAGLAETAEAVRARGARIESVTADISSAETCRSVVEQTVAAYGRLDALCNVAGIIRFTHAHEMTTDDWARTIGVNLSGPFFLMQAAIPHLIEAHGAIVNVTSTAAFIGEAYAGAYCASKAGLLNLTRALAMEYVNKPIRINAVAPGGMMTGLAMNIVFPQDIDFKLVERYSGLRGPVEVDEVAAMVAYLASPAAQGHHGSCVTIDRGITAG